MLVFNNIEFAFNPGTIQEKKIFSGLDLTIQKGEFVSIVGSNGAGKSTLMNLISGHCVPNQGTISLDGRILGCDSIERRAKDIARVFQNPHQGTFAELTVEENLMIGVLRGEPKFKLSTIKNMVAQKIHEVQSSLTLDIKTILKQTLNSLSGGQRQVISLLMAVFAKSNILLLDEYTSDLDPAAAREILELTANLIDKYELTTLMITHSLQEALQYGSRLIFLKQGTVALDVQGQSKFTLTCDALTKLYTTD